MKYCTFFRSKTLPVCNFICFFFILKLNQLPKALNIPDIKSDEQPLMPMQLKCWPYKKNPSRPTHSSNRTFHRQFKSFTNDTFTTRNQIK